MMRFRPFRETPEIRERYAEVRLEAEDFIYPLFVREGCGVREEIPSMKGVYRYSVDTLLEEVGEAVSAGIGKILLFGVADDSAKDERGSCGLAGDPIVCQTVRAVKAEYPKVTVITDVCLCEYTSHGHCGVLDGHTVDNDRTLPLLAEMAVLHARAGADRVAPSAMMDGQVEAIRNALYAEGREVPVMAYSAKYASGFYGPFREAAGSAPAFGDRKTYQMDYRTKYQGLQEMEADIAEGADWIMVKPAMSYLDIVSRAAERFPRQKLVAYQVSGEYSMLKTGAEAGFFDERNIFTEALTAIKRAGAHYIISYYAKEFLKGGRP